MTEHGSNLAYTSSSRPGPKSKLLWVKPMRTGSTMDGSTLSRFSQWRGAASRCSCKTWEEVGAAAARSAVTQRRDKIKICMFRKKRWERNERLCYSVKTVGGVVAFIESAREGERCSTLDAHVSPWMSEWCWPSSLVYNADRKERICWTDVSGPTSWTPFSKPSLVKPNDDRMPEEEHHELVAPGMCCASCVGDRDHQW